MKTLLKIIYSLLIGAGVAGFVVAIAIIVPVISFIFLVLGLLVSLVVMVFFIRILFKVFVWLSSKKIKGKPTGGNN